MGIEQINQKAAELAAAIQSHGNLAGEELDVKFDYYGCKELGWVPDGGEVMDRYADYAASDWFETAQYVQTTGYWAAVYVAGTWLHKISMDDMWK